MLDFQINIELRNGNPEALKRIFLLLHQRLKEYCKLFITDESVVSDIIQESIITIWEKRQTIKPDKSIESLLFVMVRNRCLNILRSQKTEYLLEDQKNIKVAELQYLYQLDFTEKEEKSIEEQLIVSMQKAIEELPAKMKEVFILTKIEGKSQKEVAAKLGITLKMVEKHISKAKIHIREKLTKQYPLLVSLILFLID